MSKARFSTLFLGFGFIYCLSLLVYSFWSYSLTAPNLVMSNWPPYWKFQTWMWETFFNNRQLLTRTFALIWASFSLSYLGMLYYMHKARVNWNSRQVLGLVVAAYIVVLPASTALSYDVFNYAFNAKMVLEYQENPHQRTALEFAESDDWVRFMHNTHTPAPYGYGWTAISLIPGWLGSGSFLLTWALFKGMSLLSLVGLLAAVLFTAKQWNIPLKSWAVTALLLNPFLLLEMLGNSHNDMWMMTPAVLSLGLVSPRLRKKVVPWLLAILLLLLSISIKLATVALVPIFFWILLENTLPAFLKKIVTTNSMLFLVASLLLFLPLLTPRSKLFLPWYFSWSLVWLPLVASQSKQYLSKVWSYFLIGGSLVVLLRYIPYLQLGEYTIEVEQTQRLVLWLALSLVIAGSITWHRKRRE